MRMSTFRYAPPGWRFWLAFWVLLGPPLALYLWACFYFSVLDLP